MTPHTITLRARFLSGPWPWMIACALMLLPFLGKPAHIDDPLFLWQARQILAHPLDPFGFDVNWIGTNLPMHDTACNPPLDSYVLAAIAALFGWHEIVFHAVFILFAELVVLGTFLLARRWTKRPWIAAAVLLACPAFLLSSTTLMCDVPMLAWFVWALFFWVKGSDEDDLALLLLGAACAIGAVGSKYFGLAVVGLMALYSVRTSGLRAGWMVLALLPVLAFALYETVGGARYGHPLISTAADVVGKTSSFGGGSVLVRIVAATAFLGGSAAGVALACAGSMRMRRLGAIVTVAVFVAVGTWAWGAEFGRPVVRGRPHEVVVVLELALWLVAGGAIVWTVRDCWKWTSPVSVILVAWIVGTLVFIVFLNWSVTGRTVLPLLPAVGIVTALAFESRPSGDRILISSLIAGAVLGLFVCAGDMELARAARDAARDLASHGPASKGVWFQGHWGFQYYAEQCGARPVDAENLRQRTADILLVPVRNTGTWGVQREECTAAMAKTTPLRSWLTAMSAHENVGFYSHIFGILPFGVAFEEPDTCWSIVLK
jgi:4-amino-4-deoxy-L-arabinose transferase-like glycosyltransferase